MPPHTEDPGEVPQTIADYLVRYLDGRPGRGGKAESYRQLELRARDPEGGGQLRRQWMIDLVEGNIGVPELWRLRALAAGMARGEAEEGTARYEDAYRRHLEHIRRLAAKRWFGIDTETSRVELGEDVIVIDAPPGLDAAGRRLVAQMASDMARRLAQNDNE